MSKTVSKKIDNNINILKNDIKEINIILENISKSVDKIPSMWKSAKEEEIMTSLKKSTDSFNNIFELNKKYIDLLNLIDKGQYETLDKAIDELKHDEIVIN